MQTHRKLTENMHLLILNISVTHYYGLMRTSERRAATAWSTLVFTALTGRGKKKTGLPVNCYPDKQALTALVASRWKRKQTADEPIKVFCQ